MPGLPGADVGSGGCSSTTLTGTPRRRCTLPVYGETRGRLSFPQPYGMEDFTVQIERLEKKSFAKPDELRTPFEGGEIAVLSLQGLTVQRETLQPGWRWSDHVKPIVGGEHCQRYHVKYILSGRQRVVMQDGKIGRAHV